MRSRTDSTRNCEPRDRTEKKSTPYMRANSAVRVIISVLSSNATQNRTRRSAYRSARATSAARYERSHSVSVAQLYTGVRLCSTFMTTCSSVYCVRAMCVRMRRHTFRTWRPHMRNDDVVDALQSVIAPTALCVRMRPSSYTMSMSRAGTALARRTRKPQDVRATS